MNPFSLHLPNDKPLEQHHWGIITRESGDLLPMPSVDDMTHSTMTQPKLLGKVNDPGAGSVSPPNISNLFFRKTGAPVSVSSATDRIIDVVLRSANVKMFGVEARRNIAVMQHPVPSINRMVQVEHGRQPMCGSLSVLVRHETVAELVQCAGPEPASSFRVNNFSSKHPRFKVAFLVKGLAVITAKSRRALSDHVRLSLVNGAAVIARARDRIRTHQFLTRIGVTARSVSRTAGLSCAYQLYPDGMIFRPYLMKAVSC